MIIEKTKIIQAILKVKLYQNTLSKKIDQKIPFGREHLNDRERLNRYKSIIEIGASLSQAVQINKFPVKYFSTEGKQIYKIIP